MSKRQKQLEKVLLGRSDHTIHFEELCDILVHLGFTFRTNGSHHIFTRDDIEEILNLQPRGHDAKAYQVKQVRDLILRYRLWSEHE
jgi:predicted RNA binding protein YcfA (HicA-like mRNA interferase family)